MKKNALFIVITLILVSACTEQELFNTYDEQLSALQNQYRAFQAHAPRFFLFGMGNREKLLYKDYQLISIANDSIVYQAKDAISDSIMPSDYTVLINTPKGTILIREDEEAVWINNQEENQRITKEVCSVTLPSFREFKYGKIMRVLHHELLFNVKDSRIYPNILVYHEPFYRDAFMAALCLEKTGNIHIIEPWLLKIDTLYDMQNGEPEEDNLGELLYLFSFIPKDSNSLLRQRLFQEIEKKTLKINGLQYLKGHTDGADNAEYQTQILKMGLHKNNMEDHFTSVPPHEAGDYFDLCWFTKGTEHRRSLTRWYKDLCFHYQDSPFPYLQWARSHYYNNTNAAFNCQRYPLSWEKRGGSAHFEGMRVISENAVEERICYPHAWTAAEMFLKLYEEQ